MKRNFGHRRSGYGRTPDPDLGHAAVYAVFAVLIFVVWVGSRFL